MKLASELMKELWVSKGIDLSQGHMIFDTENSSLLLKWTLHKDAMHRFVHQCRFLEIREYKFVSF